METLDYKTIPQPSFQIKKTKLELSPHNMKPDYIGRNKVNFRYPFNQVNSYLQEEYGMLCKIDIKLQKAKVPTVGAELKLTLDKAGILSCIENVGIKIGGGAKVTVEHVNLLSCTMNSIENDPLYDANAGNLMEATTGGAQGMALKQSVGATTTDFIETYSSATCCFQIPFTSLSNTHQNIPLFSKAPIEVEIEFAEGAMVGSFEYKDTASANQILTDDLNDLVKYSNVRLESYVIEVSDQVQRGIHDIYGGIYVLNSTTWSHSDDIIPTGTSSIASIIPIGVKSMKRVFVVHRDNLKIQLSSRKITEADLDYPLSLGHQINPKIDHYHFELDKENHPTQPVKGIQGAVYELLRADDKCGKHHNTALGTKGGASENFHFSKNRLENPFSLDLGSSGTPNKSGYNIGSYVSSMNFETMNFGRTSSILDGVDTNGLNLIYHCKTTAPLAADVRLDFFVEHDTQMVLNMNSTQIFEYYD